MPKRIRRVLIQDGDNYILRIQLGRTPVNAVLILILNLLSSWRFNRKKLELGYDEIYHNYLLITVSKEKDFNILKTLVENATDISRNITYKLEKAHRVRLIKLVYPAEFIDTYDIPLPFNKKLTLNRLISTASNIDNHFYTYDAANNNMCQTFVENILDLNEITPNIHNKTTLTALKPQNAEALIATLGTRRDIVKMITDVGGQVDRLIYDHIVTWKTPWAKEFTPVGNMHIRAKDNALQAKPEEILGDGTNADTIVIKGMVDTVVENADDVYDTILALEKVEKKVKQRRRIQIVVKIFVLVLLTVVITTVLIHLKRYSKNACHDFLSHTKSSFISLSLLWEYLNAWFRQISK